MFMSDARNSRVHAPSDTMGDISSINIDDMTEIKKDIEPYDMISLVFLLYKIPDTALQRLIIYQRVYKDIGGSNIDLLHEWALDAQARVTWKHEFLEALVTCQLHNVIRKLGFNVAEVKRRYETDNFINPMKKHLYKLCEHIESENLTKLKKTLLTYGIDTTEYEHCELIFLALMCKKFITVQQFNYGYTATACEFNVEKLAKIIDNFEGLGSFADEMRVLESRSKNQQHDALASPSTSTLPSVPEIPIKDDNIKEKFEVQDFNDVYGKLENMFKEFSFENLKSDKKMQKIGYEIKDPSNIGVCYIINQEDFYPSENSIKNNPHYKPLQKRVGSTRDKETLVQTMTKLNFEVITRDNQDHKTMIQGIKDILRFRVFRSHSIFMLCILSHGTKGYVYATDSVKVKIEHLENLLDSDDVKHLQNMPKVIVLQACQGEDDNEYPDFIADAANDYYIKKSDILLYMATAPGYEAYRLEKFGSIFIQILCIVLQEFADKEHLYDLFTKVTYLVRKFCKNLQKDQLPKIDSTLLKSLYLKRMS